MNYNYKLIGERISKERKRIGLKSQSDLAVKLDYAYESRQKISDWETGKDIPPLDRALKMCELFDCELGYLLCEPNYHERTGRDTDIAKETGLNSKAISDLINMHDSNGTSVSVKLRQIMLKTLNSLFDDGLSDLLLDIAIFKCELSDIFNEGTFSDEDIAVAQIVGNRYKKRLPGTAILSFTEYEKYKLLQFERDFGNLLSKQIRPQQNRHKTDTDKR